MSQSDNYGEGSSKIGDYSIHNNPFNDPELNKKFNWVKKKAQEGDSVDDKAREKREEFQASVIIE